MKNDSTKNSRKPTKQADFVSISDKYFGRIKHYQDDSRQMLWIKLYIDVLDDVDFCFLSDETKFHFLGLILLAAKLNNRLPNNPKFLAQKLSATSKIDIDFLVSKNFLVLLKPLKIKGGFDSKPVANGYQNACLEEKRIEEIKNENENEKKKENGDAVASPRRNGNVRGNGDAREEETRIREINPTDFHDKFLDYEAANGFKGDVYKLRDEIYSGKHNDTIVNLVVSNKI